MTGSGCFAEGERTINDNQVYTLYAEYRTNSQPSIDHCDVKIRATDSNRRLRYFVEKLVIFDCGITILIFDNPNNMNTPTRTLTCDDDKNLPIEGTTSHQVLKVSLRKESAQSIAFNFQIQVTTDFGPGFDFDKDASEFYEAPLDTGAIVGICIAGAILMIALVGLAIYCCLKNRMENVKYADHEASAGRSASAPSVFTSGTSAGMFAGPNNQRKSGGGGSYGSMEDVRSSTSSTEKANNVYANKAYQADADEKRFNRQGSYRKEKGGHYNSAFDEADTSNVRGGHVSRRDSGRSTKYDKKKNYSRNEEYEMNKVNIKPVNGILKTRSKSPNRSHSSTEGSTVDSKALVYGYSQTTNVHPNTQHIPHLERTRSRSRSRGATSHRSGSTGRSRSGSVGRSAGKDMKQAPPSAKGGRQYNDMAHFLDKPKQGSSRPRSNSVGRKPRSESRTSEHVPSEVSFATSNVSSKKTGGKRVHIQGVESDI
ncbi:hypothetical protein V1264_021121 [Littorina saxatilis]